MRAWGARARSFFFRLALTRARVAAKTWHDGTLLYDTSTNRVELLDDGGTRLDAGFAVRLEADVQLELERHLVEVECAAATGAENSGPSEPKRAKTVSFAPADDDDAAAACAPVMPAGTGSVAGRPAGRSVLDVLRLLGAAGPKLPPPVLRNGAAGTDRPDIEPPPAVLARPREVRYGAAAERSATVAEQVPPAVPVAARSVAPSAPRGHTDASDFFMGPLAWPARHQLNRERRTLRASIPPRFSSLREYADVYGRAVRELVHLSISRVAEAVYSGNSREMPQETYAQCELTHREWRGQGGKLNVALRLHLGASWKQRSRGDHQKDDVWALTCTQRWDDAFLVRAVFGGISNDGSFPVEPIGWPAKKSLPKGRVQAVRVVSASTELQELAMLDAFGEADPLCNALVLPLQRARAPPLRAAPFPPALGVGSDEIVALQLQVEQRFSLNADQRVALARVAGWFTGDNVSDVFLIHGVFGSGKSALLVAMILFLVQLMDAHETAENGGVERGAKLRIKVSEGFRLVGFCSNQWQPPPFRIAISSATNTAVDRVLEGLCDCGFTEFLRVGSLRKMSRKVLPYTLYEEEKDALHELRKQLNSDDLSVQERLDLECELEEVRSGRAAKRKERLHVTPVVGTTCSASTFKLFKEQTFEIVLLDEASQMIEPLSLLPIGAFHPRKLLVVGDPMQLAPPLPTERAGARDLSLALFSRLAPHYAPLVLRTQYRCHPRIAAVASRLFYQNTLTSGIAPEQRAPQLDGLDTLMFIDVAGMGAPVVRGDGGSHCNPMHTRIAVMLLQRIAAQWPSAEVMAQRVGVIALFRAQVEGAVMVVVGVDAQLLTQHFCRSVTCARHSTSTLCSRTCAFRQWTHFRGLKVT